MQLAELPESYRADIQTAIAVLTALGAQEVFLFGSIVSHQRQELPADIDLAVAGLPKASFFRAYGQLLLKMTHDVDLVDLDDDAPFVRILKSRGSLERVA